MKRNNFKKSYYVSKSPIFLYKTENELKQYIEDTELKLTRKETVKILLKIRDYYNSIGYTRSLHIMNLLIGNTKFHNKIIFVWDGSYRTNRIWISSYYAGSISVDYSVKDGNYRKSWPVSENYDSSLTSLKHILYNYEKIFIQLPPSEWTMLKETHKSGV